jgi:cytochrome c553
MQRLLFLGAAICAVTLTAPAHAADPAAGKKKVSGMCAVCHGVDGIAKVPDAPHLAAESAEYIVRQLQAFKSGQRQHEQMSIIAQGLSDADMANVAAWYASLKISVQMPD